MAEYIVWDYSNPGISFSVATGRIRVFKQTLVVMGYPEYFRFLYDPEQQYFGIEPCGIDDKGANRLPEVNRHPDDSITREYYEIKSKDLVRFIYESCGWKKKLSYRIAGAVDGRIVYFDLQKAYEIHEGRVKEAAEYSESHKE